MAGFGLGAAAITTTVYASGHNADVQTPVYDVSKFMCEPITSSTILAQDKDDMRVKMELLIMKTQVS